jgi:membrane protein required for colicin V production
MPIQGLDIILFAIMVFSGFLAMLRGLTREMLSIMSWALAAVVTLLAYSHFRNEVRGWIDNPMLADATLIGAVFITGLVLFSFVTSSISERVLDSRVGAVDRTLGFLFGLIRGLILVVIAYLIVGQIIDPKNMPKWVTDAQSRRLIEDAGGVIKSLLPDNPESILKREKPAAPPADADRT